MWFNKMKIDVIKYVGGPNHIAILYKDKSSKKLFVFYCYTGKPIVNIEEERESTIVCYRTAEIQIPINTYKHGVWYQLEVQKEEEFELIEKVVASIMEGDG